MAACEQALERQNIVARDLSRRIDELAREAAGVHRMVSSQVDYMTFNAHASTAIGLRAASLRQDVDRLLELR